MSRHLSTTLSSSEAHSVRQLELAFGEWLAGRDGYRHLEAVDRGDHLRAFGDSRRDLLRRRGERSSDRALTSFTAQDVDLLVARSRAQAERFAVDRLLDLKATCRLWSEYLGFLVETGAWAGPQSWRPVRAALGRHDAAERGALLGRGGHSVRTSFPVELSQLRRTPLVRAAEEVVRGRSEGPPALREQLESLGFLGRDGRRGDRRRSWDSAEEVDAGVARRRLVVAEVVRVLRTVEPGCSVTLALATSSHPADVAEGARRLEALVGTGRLGELVAAGVLPATAPWRIARGLQHSVHVALTRLVDEGVLDEDLRGPSLRAAG